ncbi:sigma-54-dependent Fis family transcriptional regulator [candidate division KSB1 bacterium]|nr:sigma-54-dependent Fis family transcriptional regulator [candidate division KSB1 bacterium]
MYKIILNDQKIDSLREITRFLITFGFDCYIARDYNDAANLIESEKPDLFIFNIDQPFEKGKQLVHNIRQKDNKMPIIAYSNMNSVQNIVTAIKSGVNEFLEKPVSNQNLIQIIENYLPPKTIDHLEKKQKTKNDFNEFKDIIGKSTSIKELFQKVQKIAKVQSTVLLIGESGTGKELIAKNIHLLSDRKNKPFIPLDCSTLPSNLLESELFGFEKGAFTGATRSKPGVLELANHGTLFLDEITELDYSLQTKLLRFLQERNFRRIGGKELINVDIKVITATNRDPVEAIEKKILRRDLYYRINVVPLKIPPLRERTEDIPLLVKHFIEFNNNFLDRNINGITQEALNKLKEYDWPGNIRELQNVIEHMMALTETETIDINNLPAHIKQTNNDDFIDHYHLHTFKKAKKMYMSKFVTNYFTDLLQKCNGNITKVSLISGLSRRQIYNILNTYNIEKKLN